FDHTTDIRMVIDAESTVHLMGLLTNLYSDQELACIREYSTNAHDAHLDAGQTRPIEVETPSVLSPFLRVRDFGVGMNLDTIREVYSKYGASTKRDQVHTNGSMGIGGKAALTYSSQFSVIAVKDGIKTVISVSKTAEGDAVMQVLEETPTNDPNGVEITIPAKSSHGFNRKAREFFKFWKPGTVLLNGEDPSKTLDKITDRIFFHDGDDDVVVMGNVPYPVESGHRIANAMGKSVAVFVTMNSADEVVFTPSREGLMYNAKTLKSLAGAREEYENHIVKKLQSEVDTKANLVEAWEYLSKAAPIYGNGLINTLTYKGEPVTAPGLFSYTNDAGEVKRKFITVWHMRRSRYAVDSRSTYSFDSLFKAKLVITGYKASGVPSAYKARIKKYLRDRVKMNESIYGEVYLTDEAVLDNAKWTAHLTNVVTWSEVMDATKEARVAAGGGTGMGGKYEVLLPGEMSFCEDFILPDDEVYFYSPKDGISYTNSVVERLRRERPKAKIVRTPHNRHGKLQKITKNAKPLDVNDLLKQYAKADFDAITPAQMNDLEVKATYDGYDYDRMLGYSAFKRVDKIKDPEYAEVLRAIHAAKSDVGYASSDPRMKTLKGKNKPIQFGERYPLAVSQWDRRAESVLE
ncbi:MAG TPA: hypothetical protein VIY48_01820, partial [Candidatus Paceibacterota bacterium]